MAKPILQRNGLELYEFRNSHVMPFHDDLSPESKKELRVAYEIEPLEALLSVINKDMAYTVMRDGHPLAMTGLESGFMWALFGNGLRKNWLRFAKASPDLIQYYHGFEDKIACDIWSRSGTVAQWLAYLGFAPTLHLTSDSGHEFIRFVRCDGNVSYVHPQALRPVMH